MAVPLRYGASAYDTLRYDTRAGLATKTKTKKEMLKVSKKDRLAALRLVILSNEMGSQEEVIQAMARQSIAITQATLSRDMKQLKVAKAANSEGRYVYALPEESAYRRVHRPQTPAQNILPSPGYKSTSFRATWG